MINSRLTILRSISLFGLTLFLISGCDTGKGPPDLRRYTENAYKDHVPFVEPLPPPIPYTVFPYTASELPDPFDKMNLKQQKIEEQLTGTGPGPDPTRRKEPLEQFPLDALNMVGTLEQKNVIWAIIQAPDLSVHRVEIGNFLGQNHGEIIGVNEGSIEIEELVQNAVGRWIVQSAGMTLAE